MNLIGGGGARPAQAGFNFDHDSDMPEGFVGGRRPSFAPSDEELLGDAAAPAPMLRGGAGIEAPSPKDPDLTPEESAKAIQGILGRYTAGLAMDDAERTLILEFGPLARLEEQLASFADDSVAPEVADVYKTQIRRAIHEAVVGTPVLSSNAKSQESLEAKGKMLEMVKSLLESRTTTLTNELIKVDAKGVFEFSNMMFGFIGAEQRRVEQMLKTMTPPTLGESLFNGLRSALSNVTSKELVGDARRHRNKQLTGALSDLTDLAKELKDKAGDAAWEQTHGPMARKGVADLSRRVQELTSGVADQVDAPALRKNLDDVQELLQDACKSSSDPVHREALETIAQRIQEMVRALVESIGRMFGRSPDTPKPA